MSWSFNPPPGWPLPSGDWTPAPGWEPDPEWPPAPPGWEFWIYTPEPVSERASGPPARTYPASPPPDRRAGRSRNRLWAGTAVAAVVLLTCSGGTVAFTWERSAPRPEPPVAAGPPAPVATAWDACDTRPNSCNSGAVTTGGSLVWGAPGTSENWNLYTTDDSTMVQILSGILPTTGWFRPDGRWRWNHDLLADTPVPVSNGPDTYQYRIRPEARWSDGTAISADDFIFAWKHNAGDDDLCDGCGPDRTGYDRIKRVTGIDGGRTVRVTFRGRNYPEWFTLFNGLYPAHVAEDEGFDLDTPAGMADASAWFEETLPGWSGGPWVLTGADPSRSVTLAPNNQWYGSSRPALQQIAVRYYAGGEKMQRALETGEIDGFGPLLDPEPHQVATTPDVLSWVGSSRVWDHLDFNLEREWTDDIALRRAIFTSIDVDEITDTAYPLAGPDTEPRHNHLFPPDDPFSEDVLRGTGQGSGDAVAAQAILDDAGYEVGDGALTKDGEQVGPLVLAYLTGTLRRELIAEQVAAALGRIGIEVEVEPGTLDVLDQRDYDLVLFGWTTGPDFINDGYTFWHSEGDGNYGGYANENVDALVDQARYAYDLDLAAGLLNQAMRYLVEDAYVLPITATPQYTAVRPDVRNIRPNPNSAAGPFYNSHLWGYA